MRSGVSIQARLSPPAAHCRLAGLRAGLLNDAGGWTDISWYQIADDRTGVELNYQTLTDRGALILWLNDLSQQARSYVDNDTRTLTEIRLGMQVSDNENLSLQCEFFRHAAGSRVIRHNPSSGRNAGRHPAGRP